MPKPKPIRVFYSRLDQRFYATRAWSVNSKGIVRITGDRYDVTDDIGSSVIEHGLRFSRDTDDEEEEAES